MYFWFINLVVKPLKGVNFDVAVWEERKWQWHILGVELKLFRRGWSGLHRGMDCKLYHVWSLLSSQQPLSWASVEMAPQIAG